MTRILELNALDPGPKYATVRNEFGQKFRRPPPDVTSIRRIMKKFKDKHTLEDQHRGRSGRPRSVRNAVVDNMKIFFLHVCAFDGGRVGGPTLFLHLDLFSNVCFYC